MEIVSGFVVGILGSLHCAGMCGPLVLALPAATGSRVKFIAGRLFYNGGRTITYILLGTAAGSVGHLVSLAGWQQALSLLAGGVLVLGVALPSLFAARSGGVARLSAWVRDRLALLFRRNATGVLFGIGLLNGLLPCGFVYVALAAAATTGTILGGALFMAGFGLGTIPVMAGVSLAGYRISPVLRRRFAVLSPAVTVLIALIIILRGMNLGIPLVSPGLPAESGHITAPCCQP